ncbi:hypothetical protein AB0M43_06255 [Longispora sp. NPDC051575]|uniref:hypothetical protein n=1 Tax=Longispora sp. NPDC051575 TaxID=3154943 RepID=UPI0034257AAE
MSRWCDTWIPRIALLVLPAVWILLAVTLPAPGSRNLTIDVSCTSGNPVVGVWIESRSGGSGFAERDGSATAGLARFVFRQQFAGPYQARVGCGGTPAQWGRTGGSADNDRAHRRLTCQDTSTDSGDCLDQKP